MKSKFFEEVSKLATAKGFEDKGVEHGLLQLYLDGELAAQVDESGSMLCHPYREVYEIMDDIIAIRDRITEVQYAEGDKPAQIKKTDFGQTFS